MKRIEIKPDVEFERRNNGAAAIYIRTNQPCRKYRVRDDFRRLVMFLIKHDYYYIGSTVARNCIGPGYYNVIKITNDKSVFDKKSKNEYYVAIAHKILTSD